MIFLFKNCPFKGWNGWMIRGTRNFLALTVLLWVGTVTMQAEPAVSEKSATTVISAAQQAWDDAAKLLINDANRKFQEAGAMPGVESREIELGEATTLLSVQPKTGSNIARAETLLKKIIAENGSDETAITAKYLLARIPQIHLVVRDEKLADERFTTLIEEHPAHPLAQTALVKRGLIRMYSLTDPATLAERYAVAAKESGNLTGPDARRDYFLLLSDVSIKTSKPPEVTLGHLFEVEKAGNLRDRALADLYVQIAEFARVAGQHDVVVLYYTKFTGRFKRDSRRYYIEEKLAALRSGGVAP